MFWVGVQRRHGKGVIMDEWIAFNGLFLHYESYVCISSSIAVVATVVYA